ncbi:hypothetical protein ED208_12665 [Stagnimonas aquatica]|uniref:Uncharacterized protein n=1 Tax=Stagnimonas aquatica TaxID=2689987 RepID=A0A3N0V7K0_9GAMM|nr:hypothetical protein [Stagnimonas aquatica]ROH88665.1 hypothetical protein ED208_12665 [Stagnimonas aquatica]
MKEATQKRLAVHGFSLTAEGHIAGRLKTGIKIGETLHKNFVLREALGEDLFAAELEADASRPLTYNAALLCRQLVLTGDYTGPYSLDMIGKLKSGDLLILRQAQVEAEKLGEG